jgi:adenosylcobinamide kinase / adenosylcobinamide-phosphate guanylyltransferase
MPRPPRGRQTNIHPAGLLAWDSSSGPPSRAMRWQMGPSSSLTVAGQRRFRTGFPSTRCAANRYAARRARSILTPQSRAHHVRLKAMKRISLITGGARSGKSSHAIALAQSFKGSRFYFIATGQALDIEMASRIEHHKATRPTNFVTVEEALDPSIALATLESRADGVILDCLTLWVSNLMGLGALDDSILASADRLAAALTRASFSSIIVTDEVGAGIVPDNPTGRRFRDLLGWTNQKIAAVANEVILMVAGYPIRAK